MARIAGVDLPRNKRGLIGLTYIYGIGVSTSKAILDKAEIDESTKVEDWTDDNIKAISRIIADDYKTEGQLSNSNEYQAFDGYWLLPWFASPQGPAPAWSAYPYQCPYA